MATQPNVTFVKKRNRASFMLARHAIVFVVVVDDVHMPYHHPSTNIHTF